MASVAHAISAVLTVAVIHVYLEYIVTVVVISKSLASVIFSRGHFASYLLSNVCLGKSSSAATSLLLLPPPLLLVRSESRNPFLCLGSSRSPDFWCQSLLDSHKKMKTAPRCRRMWKEGGLTKDCSHNCLQLSLTDLIGSWAFACCVCQALHTSAGVAEEISHVCQISGRLRRWHWPAVCRWW